MLVGFPDRDLEKESDYLGGRYRTIKRALIHDRAEFVVIGPDCRIQIQSTLAGTNVLQQTKQVFKMQKHVMDQHHVPGGIADRILVDSLRDDLGTQGGLVGQERFKMEVIGAEILAVSVQGPQESN